MPAHIIGIALGVVLCAGIIFLSLKIKRKDKHEVLSIGVAAVLGTMVNTIGVLGLIYIIYINQYAHALGISSQLAGASILAVGITNGIPEAFISAIVTIPVVLAVKKIRK
ncbi:MAG: ECF transporter S component [Sarcina sp.]